jgi:hypothetical protein
MQDKYRYTIAMESADVLTFGLFFISGQRESLSLMTSASPWPPASAKAPTLWTFSALVEPVFREADQPR